MPVTLSLGSGVHSNRWVLADCHFPSSLFFSAAFSVLFHWWVFVSSKWNVSFCPSPAPQHPGAVLPLYRIQVCGKLDETTASCLGHGTAESSFFHHLPNQVCLIISVNYLFSYSYLSCNLASFSRLCHFLPLKQPTVGLLWSSSLPQSFWV